MFIGAICIFIYASIYYSSSAVIEQINVPVEPVVKERNPMRVSPVERKKKKEKEEKEEEKEDKYSDVLIPAGEIHAELKPDYKGKRDEFKPDLKEIYGTKQMYGVLNTDEKKQKHLEEEKKQIARLDLSKVNREGQGAFQAFKKVQ